MKLLFIAAEPMEYSGILAHARDRRPARFGVDWAQSVKLAEHEAVLVANGAGRERAAAAVDRSIQHFRPDAVISTGFCGALEASLRIADIVSATVVNGYSALRLIGATPCRHGKVESIDHVAQAAAEKEHLGASGACAVEMEAAGVAERAAALGLPFYCVRAVSDLAGEDMANDFNSALRPDGHFDTIQVLRGALRKPVVRLPELLRLRSRCVRAARGLGDFFADCRL